MKVNMSKKTNLTIERTSYNDIRGDYEVVGKVSGHVYDRGSRFHCTWAISNSYPPYSHLEDLAAKEKAEEEEIFKAIQEGNQY
jgi:hypothetical protein